jgi:hypothetical protein
MFELLLSTKCLKIFVQRRQFQKKLPGDDPIKEISSQKKDQVSLKIVDGALPKKDRS